MKKDIFLKKKMAIIMAATMLIGASTGCGAYGDNSSIFESVDDNSAVTMQSTDGASDSLQEDNDDSSDSYSSILDTTASTSLQEELEQVEAKDEEISNTDTSDMTQFEMNCLAGDRYSLWDGELNSIWSRLSEKLSGSEKEKLVNEQKEWIVQKDRNRDVAGIENGGGSLAPLLMNDYAADMTRVRVYYLAQMLADLQGESFEISDEVQNDLERLDDTAEETLKALEGQWTVDNESKDCICIENKSAEQFGMAPSEWTIWVTGKEIYTENDIYGFNGSCIVFHKADVPDSVYAVFSKEDNSVWYWSGNSVNDLLNAAGIDEGIIGKK